MVLKNNLTNSVFSPRTSFFPEGLPDIFPSRRRKSQIAIPQNSFLKPDTKLRKIFELCKRLLIYFQGISKIFTGEMELPQE